MFFSQKEKNSFYEEIENVGRTEFFPSEDFERAVKRIKKRGESLNAAKKNAIDQKRNEYIQKLKDLDGWKNGLLSEKYKEEIILDMERSRITDDFQEILQRVKQKIKQLLGEDPEINIQYEIQKAIQEIEAELNKEPKVIEE